MKLINGSYIFMKKYLINISTSGLFHVDGALLKDVRKVGKLILWSTSIFFNLSFTF